MANISAQRLLGEEFQEEVFNTSRGEDREDLYGKKGISEILVAFSLIAKYIGFVFSSKSKVFNIYVTSNLAFIRDIFFIIVARAMGKKIVAHLHSKTSGELFLSGFLLKLMGRILGLCHTVIVLSDYHKAFFERHIKGTSLVVLENFVFVDDLKPEKKRTELEFLYIGRLTRKKGFYDLLDAMDILHRQGNSCVINVIGAAETDEKEAALRERIKSSGLSEMVRMHGLLSGEAKFSLFKRSAVLVFPSHFENSPIVLKEGLAAEQLIVCSDIQANMNIVGALPAVMPFEPEQPEQLAAIITGLLEDTENTLQLSRKASCPKQATDTHAKMTLSRIVNAF
ncbi:hypothetical protein BST96_08160 [Oceanicoccus sagamiensis]|uniref:Glycosyl transferase family 1 domain-containing protein n=2 Tax=Oceanicoccus sagamiensis TaxID=716816 RepID=A0A1X9N7Q2_9GAMM|nr:hypothetical protein BST96_08160 [Oceanicoccus sagamiensis]